MDAKDLFKSMWNSPRLPKPWEEAYQQWLEFSTWKEAVPDSTPEALLPLMWPVRSELQYQDGGGLNGLLKAHMEAAGQSMSKKAWKSITAMPLEDTIALFDFHRRLGLNRWVLTLPAAVDAARTAAVPVTAPLLTVLMGLNLQMEGLMDPYLTDRINFIRMTSRHLEKQMPENLDQFRATLQSMLDFLDDEGFDFNENTSVADLQRASDLWHEEQAEIARLEHTGEAVNPDAGEDSWRVAPTPGGNREIFDPQSGLYALRLHRFSEFVEESDMMNHCIGRSDGYHSKHRNGTGAFYSIRREGVTRPEATAELTFINGEWRIAQVRGPSNQNPIREANDLAQRILDGHRHGVIREAKFEFSYGATDNVPSLAHTSSLYF